MEALGAATGFSDQSSRSRWRNTSNKGDAQLGYLEKRLTMKSEMEP